MVDIRKIHVYACTKWQSWNIYIKRVVTFTLDCSTPIIHRLHNHRLIIHLLIYVFLKRKTSWILSGDSWRPSREYNNHRLHCIIISIIIIIMVITYYLVCGIDVIRVTRGDENGRVARHVTFDASSNGYLPIIFCFYTYDTNIIRCDVLTYQNINNLQQCS